ncbi:MAG: aspartyl protease family protein [Chitinophagaceae bacterium]
MVLLLKEKMRFLFSTLLIILYTSVLAQTSSKNEIPFQLLPSGHILVKAKVEGVEGSFIFDTGGGITLFTKTFFSKLKDTLRRDGGYTGFRATGERLDIDLYQVKNIELGALKKAKEEVSYLDVNLGGIDGIISLKLFETQPFTIDFNKKVLRLETAATVAAIGKTAKPIALQLEQSRDKSLTIFAYFKINDALTLQFSMDSGAGKDVYRMNSKYMKLLGIDAADTVHVKKIEKRSEFNNNYVSNIYTTRLKMITVDQQPAIDVKEIPVQFVDGLIYDGIIWINWLGSSLTFDLQNKKLLVIR